ncbi:MAG: 3-oxoacyl-[acyl-carrier protein] reductase [Candidatus Bipolaricaulis sibiricus]|uniref:3-oxoacyl-[acyl-carrier protein] reductase n=1 Tax=Bipolaricaulis sibiricus TaxID=2501609 RepID=A0A410FU71_BIPS1|nr:MAG: 3-oxoacyl-[acyl-carrier protein] reductase [Candidatus Bipolaricaulis sibiricus]
MRLEGKVALITGGAAGIGLATARRFVEEGATVSICDVAGDAGERAARDLGPRAEFRRVDVTDKAAVNAWVADVHRRRGRVDVLVNNAGIIRDHQLVRVKDGVVVGQMSEADFDLVLAVNLKGTFLCTQAVVPIMIAQRSGVVLNATSIAGLDGNFGQTNYVATKAGLVGMTKVWARELGKYGIRVNAVAPGFTATEILRTMPEKVLEGMRSRTPLGRLGEPVDIANAYLFLASDEAAYVSGAVLRVDGGMVLGT